MSDWLMSFAEYAKHRGVSRAAVSKAVDRGRLAVAIRAVGGRNLLDVQAADRAWEHNRSRVSSATAEDAEGGTRFEVFRTRDYVVVASHAAPTSNRLDGPNALVTGVASVTSFQDPSDSALTFVLTPADARTLAGILTAKAAAGADTPELPRDEH